VNTIMPYRLPLKFIGLWVANIALIMILFYATGLQEILIRIQVKNIAYLYLGAGAVLALLEQELWNKLRGNEEP